MLKRDSPWRLALLPLLAGVVFAVPAWFAGRQLAAGTREPQLGWRAVAEIPARGVAEMVREVDRESAAKPFNADAWRASIEEWKKERSYAQQRYRLFELTRGLALADFPVAMAALEKPGATGSEGELIDGIRTVFELWAERDLASARAWFEAQSTEGRGSLVNPLVDAWAQQDADGFRRWLGAQAPEHGKTFANASMRVLQALAKSDPAATLALLMKYPELKVEYRGNELWRAWAARDPLGAAARALATTDPASRVVAVSSVVYGWTSGDPEAAREWIMQLGDAALVPDAWRAHLWAVGERDPAAALAVAVETAPLDLRQGRLRDSMESLTSRDAQAVLAFGQQHPDTSVRRTCSEAAIATIAPLDPQHAAELWRAESLATGVALGEIDGVVENLTRECGLTAAVHFLESVPTQFADATKNAAKAVAASAGWLAVGEAALALPAGERRESWLTQTLEAQVGRGELATAQRLLARVPPGLEKKAATRTLATALLPDDSETAAPWLLALPDGRAELLHATERWMAKDRRAAASWVANAAHFLPEEKARLLAPPTSATTAQ